jgi:hypothetical protein
MKVSNLAVVLAFVSGVAAAAPDIVVTSTNDGEESFAGRFVLTSDSVQFVTELPGHLVGQFVFYPLADGRSVVTAVVSGCAERRGLIGFAIGVDRATQEYVGTRRWDEAGGSVPDQLATAVCLAGKIGR